MYANKEDKKMEGGKKKGKTQVRKREAEIEKKSESNSSNTDSKKKLRFLVTGACGFSGSHMVDLLLKEGYNVIATDVANMPRRWLNPEVEFIPSDLSDVKSLEKVVNSVDIIFHPAAIFNYSAPLDALVKVNVEGTRNLLNVAVNNGVRRIVLWSTAGVYSKISDAIIDESGPLGPSNNYEYSKLKQEELVLDYCNAKKIEAVIIRPAPIYGPRSLYGFANIVFGVSKLPLAILPRLSNKAVSVHVEDVVGSALFLGLREDTNGEIFNIVDDSDYSFSELVLLISRLLGKPSIEIPIEVNAKCISFIMVYIARAVRLLKDLFPLIFQIPLVESLKYLEEDTARYIAHSFRFSNKKLKSFGYILKYPDLKDGLPETIKWYKEYGYL